MSDCSFFTHPPPEWSRCSAVWFLQTVCQSWSVLFFSLRDRKELKHCWGYLKVEVVRSFFYYLGDRLLVGSVLIPVLQVAQCIVAAQMFLALNLVLHMHRLFVSIMMEVVEEVANLSVVLDRIQVRYHMKGLVSQCAQ